MYTRLLIHVEGQTEESFVNNVLRPRLHGIGYTSVGARLIGNAQQRARRGGAVPWSEVRRTVVRHLTGDSGAVSTTMVDYYGLPQSGARAWPGRAGAARLPFSEKAPAIEAMLAQDIRSKMGSNFDTRRFVPFVMMHEFEALLFSDCDRFAHGIDTPELVDEFRSIVSRFNSPEEIDDSSENAPSKRILKLVPRYEKPLFGTIAALEIGLDAMLDSCPHFLSGWSV